MGAAPGGGVVDLRAGIDGLEGGGKVFGEDGECVVGFEEGEGGGEADYAGAGHVSKDEGIWIVICLVSFTNPITTTCPLDLLDMLMMLLLGDFWGLFAV